jgi:hypothetical protein
MFDNSIYNWGPAKILDMALWNEMETARMLSTHTSTGGEHPDGLCVSTRKCIQSQFDVNDRQMLGKWKRLSPQEQLLVTLAASLQDMSVFTLAPVYEKLDINDAREVIEGTLWTMGLEKHVDVPGKNNRIEGEFISKAGWNGMMFKFAKGKCEPCYINQSQREWESIQT